MPQRQDLHLTVACSENGCLGVSLTSFLGGKKKERSGSPIPPGAVDPQLEEHDESPVSRAQARESARIFSAMVLGDATMAPEAAGRR
ncbi:hypothetical protein AAFF_G00028570 [Aldrovandia affinis]|uniref:Uncharacterized protein n=1 Tax=Aldrovandia affinis TaxID=143900 RepID=A0AAD7S4H9_9TELE|nr:hypothetical protein AAFF_G00028570 [Aldrovandia affinis]